MADFQTALFQRLNVIAIKNSISLMVSEMCESLQFAEFALLMFQKHQDMNSDKNYII